ncbi:MAG: hypothetical protein KTR29_14095 [Rhodothermaceae bacterium]|nr:hypothetical protein [Rhodothermaceae bacterium]
MSDTVIPTVNSSYWQRIRHLTFIVLAATLVVVGGFVWTGPVQTLTTQMIDDGPALSSNGDFEPEPDRFLPLEATIPQASFTAHDLKNHPERIHGEYISDPFVSLHENHQVNRDHLKQFRELLNIYESRQAEDDNFTVRVIDRRTNGLLEKYTMENIREQFLASPSPDWELIDEIRSRESSRLIGKYRRRGVPLEDIMIKWGRLDQVKRARERDIPFIEYEVQLSQTLGLSLLATELGTVETFNSDKMVSTVGARGRYQMMPYMLRKFDIHTYTLWAKGGNTIEVKEEWHPLLTMEPAFSIIRGYSNAVGHEIPGISAYHTGPFNIFFIYDMYLEQQKNNFSAASTVMDAYLWALTEGFDDVSEDTGFRHYSRSYVATAYGSFKGTEDLPVDTTQTHLTERVQTQLGEDLYLSELLEALESIRNQLDWSFAPADSSLYMQFRSFNPHINLPQEKESDTTRVPKGADVFLATRNLNRPVRFFLPLGASELLKEHGFDRFSDEHTFKFDHQTFAISEEDITIWDRQYAKLVEDVKFFGFTRENRDQLNVLVDRFEKLANTQPSNFRSLQLKIIKLHQGLWRTRYWNDLANKTAALSGQVELTVNAPPPAPIGLTKRISVAEIELIEEESF